MVTVPPVRQNEDVSNPTGTFTQGFRVPSLSFPYHPATFWERGNKKLLSPHSMFHGREGEKVTSWRWSVVMETTFPLGLIELAESDSQSWGHWLERL